MPGVLDKAAVAGWVPLPRLWRAAGLADRPWRSDGVLGLPSADLDHSGNRFRGNPKAPSDVVPRDVVGDKPEDWSERAGAPTRARCLGSYQTAWAWLHKLRRAMVRPGRERLSGRVEVDETYVGGHERERAGGVCGRGTTRKSLVAIAAEEDGPGTGRIRMQRINGADRANLERFIVATVEPGSVIHTDGWRGYARIEALGYPHKVTRIKQTEEPAHEAMPRVHRVASLLKRWLLGTHQGAVSHEHLDYYLDEFTFRFNRRRSQSRGKLLYRLVQQAVAVEPVPYRRLIGPSGKPQPIGYT